MGLGMRIVDFFGRRIDTANIETIITKNMQTLYFREVAFYIAKSYIANTLSKCEIKVYRGGVETHDELYYALNVSPNPNQCGSQFVNKIIETLYDNGESLVIKHGSNRLYCADGFAIDRKPFADNIFQNIVIESQQIKPRYKASDVFYFRLDNDNVRHLVNGINQTYTDLIGSAFSAYMQANGKKYKLVLSNYRAGDKEFVDEWNKTLKKQLKEFMESYNGLYPQFEGMSLEDFSATSGSRDSSDVIALRKEVFETTAAACKIPQPMMTGNITNLKDVINQYLSFCIDPLGDMLSEETTRKTTNFAGWSRGDYIKVDTSCISHVDILEVADSVSKAIGSGAVNIDEIRERLDKQALNTDFSSAYWMTKNYDRAENVLNGINQ